MVSQKLKKNHKIHVKIKTGRFRHHKFSFIPMVVNIFTIVDFGRHLGFSGC